MGSTRVLTPRALAHGGEARRLRRIEADQRRGLGRGWAREIGAGHTRQFKTLQQQQATSLYELQDLLRSRDHATIVAEKENLFVGQNASDVFQHLTAIAFDDENRFEAPRRFAKLCLGKRPQRQRSEKIETSGLRLSFRGDARADAEGDAQRFWRFHVRNAAFW